MHRFFVPPATLAGTDIRISGETARQIGRVLRMQPGDQVCLLDGLGWEYIVTLDGFARNEVSGMLIEKRQGGGEPSARITLYLSLLNKVDKFEWALQKCTELGAAGFEAVVATRSIADTPGPAKIERWRRIIQEAAEQSGRSLLPALTKTATLAQVISNEAVALRAQAGRQHLALMPTLEATCTLAQALQGVGRENAEIDIIIGPEGGFAEDEVKAAEEAGIMPVTLGARTLRAETAAVAALAITLHELGEMR
jgi:16S rRNA (uracil1498-N3)-methyltransferase